MREKKLTEEQLAAAALAAMPKAFQAKKLIKAANDGNAEEVERLARTLSVINRIDLDRFGRADTSPEAFAERYARRMTLNQFPDPVPEDENPDALFAGGWLRRGGGAFLISTSGAGKSVGITQAAECWAAGEAWMGIEPVRPLTIAVFQWEDDPTEVGDFRNDIREGTQRDGTLNAGDIREAEKRIVYHDATGLTGDAFLDYLAYCQERDKADLNVLNPFQSCAGCDISKNAEVTHFLRTRLDPILKNPSAPCGCVVVHHTNKQPTNANDLKAWLDPTSAAYAGAGGAELVNWARAVLVIKPQGPEGFFDLIAAKRGKRLGWKDENGSPTIVKKIAHSAGIKYWREVTEDEIEAAKTATRLVTNSLRSKIVLLVEKNGKPYKSKQDLVDMIEAAGICQQTKARQLIKAAVAGKELVERPVKGSNAKAIGTPEQFGEEVEPADEAAPEWWQK